MASQNLSQLRRIVLRKYDATAKKMTSQFIIEPDDLGQDTILTFNIAPRTSERASSVGTTSTPIPGTFDSLSASITMLADNWASIGKALGNWNKATFEGATAANGNIIGGAGDNLCGSSEYIDVVVQGVCDDGSATDVEFTRCYLSMTDDITLGGSDTTEVTINLNPIAYNPNTHADDGYPTYTFRLGDYSTDQNMRLNATTGEYEPVTSQGAATE
ncbi:MAG: hypothetical protein NC548_27215 [Lachnospiraceae bacterium]|nr:hypothetical protein [Lachnospiraceae bacterium]